MGVSGSISCIIRAAPLYGQDRLSAHIFATKGREQYLLEGIVVALWTIGCSFSFVLTYYSTKIPFPPLRHVGVILGLAMFAVFILQLWQAYTEKTPWYNIKDTLPSELWAMLSSGIKKNTGIFKRLVRLSEIYLSSSYKNLKSFRLKADTILLNYLKRIFQPYFSSFMKQESS